MKKRLCAVILSGLLTIGLTGCGEIQELTQEQTKEISQYAAGLLLEYDQNNTSRLMSEDTMTKLTIRELAKLTVAPTAEPEPTQPEQGDIQEDLIGAGGTQETVDNRTLAEFFSLNQIAIEYTGYQICDSYPETDAEEYYFAMDAVEGMKLLVVHLSVKNESSEVQTVDLLNLSPRIRFYMNGGKQINAEATLLTNDFRTMHEVMNSGDVVDMVVVAEVTEEEAASIETLQMTVKLADDSITKQLQ